ncbi:MAG: sialidase family protein, partial [Kiritimatiellia bacterium]
MALHITVESERLVTRAGMRAPHLLKLKNGDLLLTFHVDPDMHFARRVGMRSSDNGRTWQDDPPRNYKEMAWGELANGVVLTFDRDAFEQHPGVYLGTYYRSEDGGRRFRGPLESRQFIPRTASRDYPVSTRHYPEEHHVQYKFYSPVPAYYQPLVAKASCRRGFGFWRYILEDDARLLVAMQGYFHGDVAQRSILAASEDEGLTWRFVSTIA